MKELNIIQTKLNAPKGKKNDFGGFKYRSLEDICEALKPLLNETGCTLTFTDDLVLIGDRYYVKSTAVIKNGAGESEQAVAFAREQESKKGMDEAQVTGSASSYARKYAACSLLCIDDNNEPDMCDNREEGQKPAQRQAPRPAAAQAAPAAPAQAAKPRITKGTTITRQMVESGQMDSVIKKLAQFKGKTPEFGNNSTIIRDYYKWDDMGTFGLLVERAKA